MRKFILFIIAVLCLLVCGCSTRVQCTPNYESCVEVNGQHFLKVCDEAGKYAMTSTPCAIDDDITYSCQNFPPPSFCPGGTADIIVTGTSEGGCAIYGCRSQLPNITLISPNGGEEWQIGGDYDIFWNSTNVTNANIYLEFPDGALCYLKTEPASQGNYLFHFLGGYECPNISRVPHSEPNNNYKITLLGDTPNVNDSSDDYFLIMYSPEQPAVTVVSPNGGEQWVVGHTYNIKWNTTLYDPSGQVDLQLCDMSALDGRGLCAQITNPLISNSGTYSWTIPPQLMSLILNGKDIYQIEARIWPEGLTRWARIDMSNSNFSIMPTKN